MCIFRIALFLLGSIYIVYIAKKNPQIYNWISVERNYTTRCREKVLTLAEGKRSAQNLTQKISDRRNTVSERTKNATMLRTHHCLSPSSRAEGAAVRCESKTRWRLGETASLQTWPSWGTCACSWGCWRPALTRTPLGPKPARTPPQTCPRWGGEKFLWIHPNSEDSEVFTGCFILKWSYCIFERVFGGDALQLLQAAHCSVFSLLQSVAHQ